MFVHKTKIRLRHTDATGVLFFPEQLTLALEAFEDFLESRNSSLKQIFQASFLLPVVHVEANYTAPLRVGDPLEIALTVKNKGTSSITLAYRFFDPVRKIEVGTAEIVHVVVDRQKYTPLPIPEMLLQILT